MKQKNLEMKKQNEVLEILNITPIKHVLQTLCYLRLGRRQTQRKPNGLVYKYVLKPQMKNKEHWLYYHGRVYYTIAGIEFLKTYFKNKQF